MISEFNLKKLSQKLEKWYLLSFAEFLKELAKKRVKLSLAQKAEWQEYFEGVRARALTLKTLIDTTDQAIDQMVYALYEPQPRRNRHH
ncbi:MAG: hypothetical protein R2865_06405 [Deinococcales bacterium]